jgi:hypothetical protein
MRRVMATQHLADHARRLAVFALRAITLGGFVAFPDNAPSVNPRNDPDLLSNRPLCEQARVIPARLLANLPPAWPPTSAAP